MYYVFIEAKNGKRTMTRVDRRDDCERLKNSLWETGSIRGFAVAQCYAQINKNGTLHSKYKSFYRKGTLREFLPKVVDGFDHN